MRVLALVRSWGHRLSILNKIDEAKLYQTSQTNPLDGCSSPSKAMWTTLSRTSWAQSQNGFFMTIFPGWSPSPTEVLAVAHDLLDLITSTESQKYSHQKSRYDAGLYLIQDITLLPLCITEFRIHQISTSKIVRVQGICEHCKLPEIIASWEGQQKYQLLRNSPKHGWVCC